jgi:hypothetical protein
MRHWETARGLRRKPWGEGRQAGEKKQQRIARWEEEHLLSGEVRDWLVHKVDSKEDKLRECERQVPNPQSNSMG